MAIFNTNENCITATSSVLLLFMTSLIPYQQQLHHFTAEAGGVRACIDYNQIENTITITCNASFLGVVQAINDPAILED